jgi:hypothetical protein
MRFVNSACIAAVCTVCLICGCSNSELPTYPVHGKVVFRDGETLKLGNIECKSVEHGVQARGQVKPDGTFTLSTYSEEDGAVAGKHVAVITQMVFLEDAKMVDHHHAESEHVHPGLIHSRHGRYDTSDLQFTVTTDGPNTVELVVEADSTVP